MIKAKYKIIDFKFVAIVLFVVIISCLIHEFGHFITGISLGNKMGMTLNKAYPVSGDYSETWHYFVVVSAGPVFTMFQAVVALILLHKYATNAFLFAFLIEPVTLRVWPYLVSPVMSQDETIISDYLGLSPWILPVGTWLLLGTIAWIGSKRAGASGKSVMLTILLILLLFQVVLRSNNLIVSLLN